MKPMLCGTERRDLYIRVFLRILTALLICLILFNHFDTVLLLIVLFLVPYFLAKALNKAVNFLSQKLRVSRRILSFICVSAMAAALGALLYTAAGQITDEILQLAESREEIQTSLTSAVSRIAQMISGIAGQNQLDLQTRLISLLQSGLQWLNEQIASWTPPIAEQAGNLLETMMTVFLSCVLFFAACFYFTADYPDLKNNIQEHMPAILRGRGRRLRQAVRIAAGGYLRSQLILSGFVMVFLLIGFALTGQRYKVILSILIAIVDFIPLFGSGTILIPWGLVALLSGNYSQSIFLFIMAAFLFVFRKIAEPKVMSNQTGLSTLVSLMCIYVGMKADGLFGMIVAPVACLVIRNLYQAGMFDNTLSDFKLLWLDLQSLLKVPEKEQDH